MRFETASGMVVDEQGAGMPVVFVHGALSDYRAWEHQARALAARCRTLSVSLRAYYPETAWDGTVSAETQLNDLLAFVETLERPVLVGHSRGGRLALEVAARSGKLLRGLVLHEPGGRALPGFYDEAPPPASQGPARPDILGLVLAQARSGDRDGALRAYVDHGHGAGCWDSLAPELRQILLSNTHTLPMMAADASLPLSKEQAKKVQVPTLLLDGSASPEIFGRTLDVLAAAIPQSRRRRLEGCNHFANWMTPKPFNTALLAFLAEL